MDYVKMKFYGEGETDTHTIEVSKEDDNNIYIEIDMNLDHQFGIGWIALNKSTAVQLVKKLKLEISKINQDGKTTVV